MRYEYKMVHSSYVNDYFKAGWEHVQAVAQHVAVSGPDHDQSEAGAIFVFIRREKKEQSNA